MHDYPHAVVKPEPYDVRSPAAKQRCVQLVTVIGNCGLHHFHSKTASCGLAVLREARCMCSMAIYLFPGWCVPMQQPSTHTQLRIRNESYLKLVCTVAQRNCCKKYYLGQ